MSYRARTDIFLQYRRSYKTITGIIKDDGSQKNRLNGQYTVVNVDEADDNWMVWMSSLGRLRRYIHEIEERVAQLEEQLELEQWPKIEFRFESVPGSPAKLNSTVGSSSEFLLACDRIKNMFSSAQKQVCLLTAGKQGSKEGGQCRQLKSNAQVSMNSRLNEAATKFRSFQTTYIAQMEKNVEFLAQRVSKAPAASILSPKPLTHFFLNDKGPMGGVDGEDYEGSEQISLMQPLAQPNIDAQISAERQQAIHRIADSVLQLKGIIEHMSSLTIEQGSMLDRIDMHISETAWFTARAEGVVERRATVQKDYLIRKVVLLGLLFLVIITFLHLITRSR